MGLSGRKECQKGQWLQNKGHNIEKKKDALSEGEAGEKKDPILSKSSLAWGRNSRKCMTEPRKKKETQGAVQFVQRQT